MDITSSGKWSVAALFLLTGIIGANAANFVANSSFELGPARGWTYWADKDNQGSPLSLKSQISGGAVDGAKCVRIPANYSLHSKPIYLVAGVTYTLSYYVKSDPSPNTFVAEMSQMGDIHNGQKYSSVPPTSWTRNVHQFTPPVSYWHFVNFFHFQNGLTVYVDAVQLEAGGSASAYSASAGIEVGLECTNAYNALFASDPRHVQLSMFNSGATVTNRTFYTIYDLWNRTRATGTVYSVLPPGLSTTNISLVVTGFNRVVTRLPVDDSWDEITANVLPFEPRPNIARTNGVFGTHANYDTNQVSHLRKVGFSHVRVFSPAINLFRWLFVEPSQGVFTWQADASYDAISTNGLVAVACLSDSDRLVNPWATNGAGVLNIPAYSNYVWNAVNRYKTKVKHWEIWNEPQQSGFPWITDANNYASVLGPASRAVKAADPTAKVIGIGGAANEVWARQAWDALSAGDKANVDIISCHLYPSDNDQWDDQNNGSVDTRPFQWKSQFTLAGINRELWNTEAGTWSRGGYLTENAIWGYRFGDWEEWLRPEEMARSLKSVNRIIRSATRCFGNGFRMYMNYDSRHATDVMMDNTHSTGWEITGGHKPTSIALQIMSHFIDEFTSGNQFAHASSSTPEMYLFTKGVTNVVIAFNHDRISRLLTVTNDSFTAYDVMGNVVPRNATKVVVTGTPQYFVSTSLASAQLQAIFANSTVSSLADTNPPGLSIDIAPSGIWPGGGHLIKWTAYDDTYWNIGTSFESKTNVSFSYKWDNGSYPPFSQTNFISPTISAGNHTLWVKARDRLNNETEVAYVFDPTTVQEPPPPPPGDTNPVVAIQATVTPSRIRGR